MKANPAFSMDDYLWRLSAPFVKILATDQTYVKYLSDKQAKLNKAKKNSVNFDDMLDDELMNDAGVPVFN